MSMTKSNNQAKLFIVETIINGVNEKSNSKKMTKEEYAQLTPEQRRERKREIERRYRSNNTEKIKAKNDRNNPKKRAEFLKASNPEEYRRRRDAINALYALKHLKKEKKYLAPKKLRINCKNTERERGLKHKRIVIERRRSEQDNV